MNANHSCGRRTIDMRPVWYVLFGLHVVQVGVRCADAAPIFTGATGGEIAFGVAPLGPPVSPGAPTYLLNLFNGRNDILVNPGLGLTANPVVANNTSSVVAPGGWGPGGGIFNVQYGGGNAFGPFGAGGAVTNGSQFGYFLSDGGVPGGVSASYELLTWDANFTEVGGSPVGSVGTFISMGGRVPLVQDLALVALRTQLIGPAFPGGVVELPGLILAVERTGSTTYNALALQDNLGGAAFGMPGGYAVLIEPLTGNFRALAFNVFPDNLDGAIDGLAIPAGAAFTARVTASIYSDPSMLELINPADHPDLVAAAEMSTGTSLPTGFLMGFMGVPEPGSLALLMIGVVVCSCTRRRR